MIRVFEMKARSTGILVQACWFGLITGFGEVALLGVKKFVLGRPIWFGPDVAWLAPAADLALFLACGVLLIAASTWKPARAPWIPVAVFAFLAFLSWLLMYYPIHPYAKLLLAAGGAAQCARLLSGRHGFHRLVRHTTPWLAGGLIVLAVGIQAAPALARRHAVRSLPAPPAGAPNVLLIVTDTVRADHMSLYGYGRSTSPNLERWAARSVVFDRAISTAPWTLPSHASMFTGLWPHEFAADVDVPFSSTSQTLAEVLRAHGYMTAGFVANTTYCGYEFGLSRGFVDYDDYPVSSREWLIGSSLLQHIANSPWIRRSLGYYDNITRRNASTMADRFLRWVDSAPARPFFAFVNLYDAHEAYMPPRGFADRLGPHADRHNERIRQLARSSLRLDWQLRPPDEINAEINEYDAAIAFQDAEIDRMLGVLRTRGSLENTIIVVTSDHGEQLGEHGLFVHGNSLYDPLLHVPLLVSYPEKIPQGRRIPTVVTLRDLPATIAELAGLAATFPGQSLSRYWTGTIDDGLTGIAALTEVRKAVWPWSPQLYPITRGNMASLTTDRYKYIRNDDGQEELYDIQTDPEEWHDLRDDRHARPELDKLRASLSSMLSSKAR
jgi:arylsulfatase A-like enzyme